MAHRVDGRKLGRPTDHRARDVPQPGVGPSAHEKIITTEAKAKEVRGLAERMITLGKRGDLHARRQALALRLRQARCREGVRRARPALLEPPGWLHADHQAGTAPRRRRQHGAARAAGGGERSHPPGADLHLDTGKHHGRRFALLLEYDGAGVRGFPVSEKRTDGAGRAGAGPWQFNRRTYTGSDGRAHRRRGTRTGPGGRVYNGSTAPRSDDREGRSTLSWRTTSR